MTKTLNARLDFLQYVLEESSAVVRTIRLDLCEGHTDEELKENLEKLTNLLADTVAEIVVMYATEPSLKGYIPTLDFKMGAKLEQKMKEELK